MTWGIAEDLTMTIMEVHSPGASLLVVSVLLPDAMIKGVSGITTKLSYVSYNSRSVHIDGDESLKWRIHVNPRGRRREDVVTTNEVMKSLTYVLSLDAVETSSSSLDPRASRRRVIVHSDPQSSKGKAPELRDLL
ncbi:hypothetical protein Sjap_004284 [Stephania japonica]|uniref:Uncharacterized protein n=1 Tax=Stephania japonica TaxID=461633 RepID=A0AAP0K2A3_9MAGN